MSKVANMNPKNLLLLAMLGIGAYMLATRKAAAQTLSPRSATAKPQAIWSQSPTRAITANGQPANAGSAGQQSILPAAFNFINGLLSANTAPLYRPPGYTPGYFPDNMGEAAAAQAYQANPDAFATNVPNYKLIDATPWAEAAINDPTDY